MYVLCLLILKLRITNSYVPFWFPQNLVYDKLLVLTFLYERTIKKAAWIVVRFLVPEREFAYSIKVACKTGLENFLWLWQYKHEYTYKIQMLYMYSLTFSTAFKSPVKLVKKNWSLWWKELTFKCEETSNLAKSVKYTFHKKSTHWLRNSSNCVWKCSKNVL